MNCSFYLYMLCHLTGFSISYSETDLCPVRCGVQFLQGVLQLRLSTAACAGCLVCLLEAGLSLYSLRPPLNCEFCQDGSGFLFPVSSALCMLISEDWLKAEPQPTRHLTQRSSLFGTTSSGSVFFWCRSQCQGSPLSSQRL